jgi:hypothetical protein
MLARWQRQGRCVLGCLALAGVAGPSVAVAANAARGHKSGISAHSSLAAHGVPECAEPQLLEDSRGTVGRPCSLKEEVACLPGGDTFSNPVIDWGDGTRSPGVIAASRTEGRTIGSVSVEGRHTYKTPGNFHITIQVTDDRTGQTYEGGWHTSAMIGPPSPSSPAKPTPVGPAPKSGGQAAPVSARGRVFTTARGKLRREVLAAVVSRNLAAAQLRARVSWGDGTASSGTVTGSVPALRVSGRHRWRHAGHYAVTVTLTGPSGQTLARAVGRANVL